MATWMANPRADLPAVLQRCRRVGKKVIGGRVRGASLHQMTKPYRSTHTVNDPVAWGKFTPIPARSVCDTVVAGGSRETSAPQGCQEVSRRHSSQMPGVMPRTGRRPEQRSQGGRRPTRGEAQTQKRGAEPRIADVPSALHQTHEHNQHRPDGTRTRPGQHEPGVETCPCQQRRSRGGWHHTRCLSRLDARALAGDPAGHSRGNLHSVAGAGGGNSQGIRRGASVGDPYGHGPGDPTGHRAGAQPDVGAGIFGLLVRVQTSTLRPWSCQAGEKLHQRRTEMGGGYRPGEVLRPRGPPDRTRATRPKAVR